MRDQCYQRFCRAISALVALLQMDSNASSPERLPPFLVNLEVTTICQDFACLSPTRHIRARAAPKKRCSRWQWLVGQNECDNPKLPPSTCYPVCGSEIMAVRHCCNATYTMDHAISKAHVLYGRCGGLGQECTLLHHQPSDFEHCTSDGPYRQ